MRGVGLWELLSSFLNNYRLEQLQTQAEMFIGVKV